MLAGQQSIPFEPDAQELAMMANMVDECVLASQDTDNFKLWDRLAVERYVTKHHCPNYGGVYQFSLSLKGRELLQQTFGVLECPQ